MNYEVLIGTGTLVLGLVLGYFLRQSFAVRRASSIEKKLKEKIESAERESKELVLKAKDKAVSILEEAKREEKERFSTLERTESRLLRREELLEKDGADVKARENKLSDELVKFEEKKTEVAKLKDRIESELSRISGLTKDQAKNQLIKEIKDENRDELALMLQKLEKEKKEEVEKKSLDVITSAIQRYARSSVSDITTTAFTLPSEDLKGKIIGREGRNIKTLERLTGAELIIDETPDTIIISSFDPFRREIAKFALEKLIRDGRIQPAKIEEKVEEAKAELDKRIVQLGEEAVYEVGILDLPPEIVKLLGRLHFRTSFGQNVLSHSIETAYIAAMIAEELGVNVEIARKAALLHDIGKAIDHEVAGNHTELGRKILKKYGLGEAIIEAMQSHHEDYPFSSPESFIVGAADTLSAARPGARRGTLENYIRRLSDLERVASSFEGVKTSYAISAGRELRVFVVPEKVDDFGALALAKEIANRIESELKYPGDIKVNVIREIRAVEYAR
jgi:ribonuclease Y